MWTRRAPRSICSGPTLHGANPRDELTEPERLHHVVVGADLQEPDAVELVLARGDDDDRDVAPGADAAADLAAVEIGETEIQQHEVSRFGGVHGLSPAANPGRREPFELEALDEGDADGVVVFDHEHRGRVVRRRRRRVR
jgi:hypothetical protein